MLILLYPLQQTEDPLVTRPWESVGRCGGIDERTRTVA
jgi:hypothetical protein